MTEKDIENIGTFIDLPIEEFKKMLFIQKCNIGTLLNLKLILEVAFNELTTRKEEMVTKCTNKEIEAEDQKTKDILNGLYLEMMRIEEKHNYLTELIMGLSNVN